ncbi:hypothetical protein Leryth_012814 [Lithospermum erythrorhizon]|nr:hypothetical protein Leryth_012814 [Lithospermum erythrorhizon]
MISPEDNVLVAFSGGPSSRVALQFVHELQERSLKNFEACRDRSLPVFGVGVAFIDESAIQQASSYDFDKAVEEMKLVVSNLSPPVKKFHVCPTDSIYSLDSNDGREKLNELISSITDVTGKEDLMEHLRMLSLQKIALDHKYTKIILGTCTSRIACRVLEATVKGQGYSLSADIQYVDARWETPVVLPLRDCLQQELSLLCSLDSLKTMEVFNGLRSGINGLITTFVKLLQEENPSRENTIVRTAGKLTPFHFNKLPEDDNSVSILASRRRQKKYNLQQNEAIPLNTFCSVCNSPLKETDTKTSESNGNGQISRSVLAASCASCQFQILPKEGTLLENFCSLLPPPVTERGKACDYNKLLQMREQIQDCLLSDTDDET